MASSKLRWVSVRAGSLPSEPGSIVPGEWDGADAGSALGGPHMCRAVRPGARGAASGAGCVVRPSPRWLPLPRDRKHETQEPDSVQGHAASLAPHREKLGRVSTPPSLSPRAAGRGGWPVCPPDRGLQTEAGPESPLHLPFIPETQSGAAALSAAIDRYHQECKIVVSRKRTLRRNLLKLRGREGGRP